MSANMVGVAIQIVPIFNAIIIVFLLLLISLLLVAKNTFSRSTSTTIVSNFRLLCTQLLNVFDDQLNTYIL